MHLYAVDSPAGIIVVVWFRGFKDVDVAGRMDDGG